MRLRRLLDSPVLRNKINGDQDHFKIEVKNVTETIGHKQRGKICAKGGCLGQTQLVIG